MELEFTTTACNRPELLDKTYESFVNKLQGVDYDKSTLYINIDPTPNLKAIWKVVKVAKKYFGNVIYNIPPRANFTKALLWCFNQPKGKYFFHLEDDWELRREIHIQQILRKMGDESLSCAMKWTWSPNYCPQQPGLLPSVWRKKYLDIILPHFDEKLNPEHTLHKLWRSNFNNIQKYSNIYLEPCYVLDIGIEWRKERGILRFENEFDLSRNKWKSWTNWVFEEKLDSDEK